MTTYATARDLVYAEVLSVWNSCVDDLLAGSGDIYFDQVETTVRQQCTRSWALARLDTLSRQPRGMRDGTVRCYIVAQMLTVAIRVPRSETYPAQTCEELAATVAAQLSNQRLDDVTLTDVISRRSGFDGNFTVFKVYGTVEYIEQGR